MSGGAKNAARSPGSASPGIPKAVLVVGAHREELAFGERVAEGLDPVTATVLHIPEGISGHRPRPDEIFYYETRHRELYLQLRQQIRGRYELVIDLHRGVNQGGRCADVFCRDTGLLRCVQLAALRRYGDDVGNRLVRTVPLASGTQSHKAETPGTTARGGAEPFGKTVIPEIVWDSEEFLYVGLEIYLTCEDEGQADDWGFARWLIHTVVACQAV